MDLTDNFTWEDLPTRDADTGHLTAAGWIPLTMKYSRNAAIAVLCFHSVQSTIRIVTNHETILNTWYPFDWTVSPFYELVNISQVSIYRREFSSLCFCSIFSLTYLVNWQTFFLSFFLSVLFPTLLFYDDLKLQNVGRLAEMSIWGWWEGGGARGELKDFRLTVALSRNISADVGGKGKIIGYPLYLSAPSEYSCTAIEQYKLFRLSFVSLRDLTLCRI